MALYAIDMDGVCCDLVPPWVKYLNRYCGENLNVEDITLWEISDCCKKATVEQVLRFLKRPGIFIDLQPIKGALDGINKLLDMGHDVVFLTACSHHHGEKIEWLKDHLPRMEFPRDVVFAERKELVAADYLLDDREQNLIDFGCRGIGKAVCFDTPYNQNWPGDRVKSWDEFITKYS